MFIYAESKVGVELFNSLMKCDLLSWKEQLVLYETKNRKISSKRVHTIFYY